MASPGSTSSAPPPGVRLRRRRPSDLPRLVEVLGAQQAASGYPRRWPLPFPVEDFVCRAGEQVAWVATLDERVVGHVSVLDAGDDATGEAFRAATGRADLGVVAVLFIDAGVRGRGIGATLLEVATRWTRSTGRLPVLDVFASHPAALALYRSRGWREIGTLHPEWLPQGEEPLIVMSVPD